MRFKRRKVLIILGLIVLTAVCLPMLWPRNEPKYNGRYLSDWLLSVDGYGIDLADVDAAERAVRSIGTNALPCLLEWTAYEPAKWKLRLFDKLPMWLQANEAFVKALCGRRYLLAQQTHLGFGVLGTNAAQAIPQLEQLLNDPQRSSSTGSGLFALGAIGAPAFPVLTNALANPQHHLRGGIIFVLGNMALDAGVAQTNLYLPVLVQSCNDSNSVVRAFATNALRRLAQEGIVILPAD